MLPIRPQQPPTNPLPINLLVGWPNGSSGLDNASTITYRQVQLMDSAVRQKIIESAEQRLQFLEILLSGSASTEGLDSNQIKELRKFRKTVEQEKERLPFGERSTNLSKRAQELQASLQSVIELSIQDLAQVRQDDQDDQLQELATAIEKVEKSGVLASIFCPEIALDQERFHVATDRRKMSNGAGPSKNPLTRDSGGHWTANVAKAKTKPAAPLNLSDAKQLQRAMSQLAAQVVDQDAVDFDAIIANFVSSNALIGDQIKQIPDTIINEAEQSSSTVAKGLFAALRNQRIALSADNVAQRVSLIEANINSTSNPGLLGSRQADDEELQTPRPEEHESTDTTPEPSATGTTLPLLPSTQKQGDETMSRQTPTDLHQSRKSASRSKAKALYNPSEFVIVLRKREAIQGLDQTPFFEEQASTRGDDYKLTLDQSSEILSRYNNRLRVSLYKPEIATDHPHLFYRGPSLEAALLNQTVDEIIFQNIQEAGRTVFSERRTLAEEEVARIRRRGGGRTATAPTPPLKDSEIAQVSFEILKFAKKYGRVSNLKKLPSEESSQAIEELNNICRHFNITTKEAQSFSATCQDLNEETGVFTGRSQNLKQGAEKSGNRLAYTSDRVVKMMYKNLQNEVEISQMTRPSISNLERLREIQLVSEGNTEKLQNIAAEKKRVLRLESQTRAKLKDQERHSRKLSYEMQTFQLGVIAINQDSNLSPDKIIINQELGRSLLSDSEYIIDISENLLARNRSIALGSLSMDLSSSDQERSVEASQIKKLLRQIDDIETSLKETLDQLYAKANPRTASVDLDEETENPQHDTRRPSVHQKSARTNVDVRASHPVIATPFNEEAARPLSFGDLFIRGNSPTDKSVSSESSSGSHGERPKDTDRFVGPSNSSSASHSHSLYPSASSLNQATIKEERVNQPTSSARAGSRGPNPSSATQAPTKIHTHSSDSTHDRFEESDSDDDSISMNSLKSSNTRDAQITVSATSFSFGDLVPKAVRDDEMSLRDEEVQLLNHQTRGRPASRSGTPNPVTMTAAAPSGASTQPQAPSSSPSIPLSRSQSPVSITSRTTQGAGLQDPSLQSASVAGSGHSSGNRGGGSFLNRLGSATISAASAIGSAIKVTKGGGGRDDA